MSRETSVREAAPEPLAEASGRELPFWKKILFAAVAVALVLLLILLLAEAGLRVAQGKLFCFENFRQKELRMLEADWPVSYHPTLGWTPTPNSRGTPPPPLRLGKTDFGCPRMPLPRAALCWLSEIPSRSGRR